VFSLQRVRHPKDAAEQPDILAESQDIGVLASSSSSALLSAWIMFIVGTGSDPQLAALFDHPPVRLLEHPFEHLLYARLGLAQCADGLGRLDGCPDLCVQLIRQRVRAPRTIPRVRSGAG